MKLSAVPQRVLYGVEISDLHAEALDYYERANDDQYDATLYKTLDEIGGIHEIEYGYGNSIFFSVDSGDEHRIEEALTATEEFLEFVEHWYVVSMRLKEIAGKA